MSKSANGYWTCKAIFGSFSTLLPREGDKFTIKSARGFEDILHPVLYLGVFKGDLKCFTT